MAGRSNRGKNRGKASGVNHVNASELEPKPVDPSVVSKDAGGSESSDAADGVIGDPSSSDKSIPSNGSAEDNARKGSGQSTAPKQEGETLLFCLHLGALFALRSSWSQLRKLVGEHAITLVAPNGSLDVEINISPLLRESRMNQ